MKEFVYGTAAQFDALDHELSRGIHYKFPNRQLPDSCIPATAAIWFSKENNVYCMYIDKGITTTSDNQDFTQFLRNGKTKFICMDDMVSFLHSLQPLFPPPIRGTGSSPKAEDGGKSGLPFENVYDKERLQEIREEATEQKMVWPEEIAALLKRKVYGQDEAVDEIATKVAKSRLRKDKKLLVMVLIGPTATGKSETAKSLAEVLTETTGTQYGYIEAAGSEFQEEHAVSRFFGAPPGYVGYGSDTILEPVRKNPCHVIVINEIEKAHVKMLTGLMEAIDTGYLGMADNTKPINLNQCILFFTSNLPIDMDKYKQLTRFEKSEMCRDAFTRHCKRPEISGKIGSFIVFNALNDEARLDIVVKFIREEMRDYELELVRIDEHLLADFLKNQTKYGARAIRELVSDSLGAHLLRNRKLESLKNRSVSIKGTMDHIEFEIA